MIDRDQQWLSLVRQCVWLASVYYWPTPTRTEDLELVALMDRQYLKTPRKMKAWQDESALFYVLHGRASRAQERIDMTAAQNLVERDKN